MFQTHVGVNWHMTQYAKIYLDWNHAEFNQAVRSAEAYAGAGFSVAMISATGRFLMAFEPRGQHTSV